MSARAVERSGAALAEAQKMVDHELLSWLTQQGGLQREVALRLKYRKLYKRVLAVPPDALTDEAKRTLVSFKDPGVRRRAEDRIAARGGLTPGRGTVDG